VPSLSTKLQSGDRKKTREIVEIVQNQKNGRQIAPSRSPLKDLSVYEEVGDLTAVSDGYGKSDAHLPRFFRSHVEMILPRIIELKSKNHQELVEGKAPMQAIVNTAGSRLRI